MGHEFTDTELEAYIDELLPAAQMALVEQALRDDEQLRARLTEINGRRDAGLHSLGGIWRRHRLSCPTRDQLGSYLLGVLPDDLADYITFHLETIACRYCTANIEDLRSAQQTADSNETNIRRQKYFESSAGYLSGD